MPDIDAGAATVQQHERSGYACCSDIEPAHCTFSAVEPRGEHHAMVVDGDRLILAEDDRATVFSVALTKSGMFSLGVGKNQSVAVVDGVVQVAETGTPFWLEAVSGEPDHFRLRIQEGSYLATTEPGAPISLTSQASANTIFHLQRKNQFGAKWEAEENFPYAETHSTHLWILNRAIDLISRPEPPGTGAAFRMNYNEEDRLALRWCLANMQFLERVKVGIYDADNKGVFDVDTSGIYYSAHFYNIRLGRGGTWDTDPNVNAYNYGTRYFRESLEADDPIVSGYKLGLAIHYLEDLTQPMHCGIYRNDVFDWRHENYEKWALRVQENFRMSDQDLDTFDAVILKDDKWTDYWTRIAVDGLEEYDGWLNVDTSPIGSRANWQRGSIPDFADSLWTPSASKMIKTAQRLVINLLLTWAALSKLGAKNRGAAAPADLVLGSGDNLGVVAGMSRLPGENASLAYYRTASAVGDREAWMLEPVLESGKPALDGSNPIYYIKNRKADVCMVSGDDRNVHLQANPTTPNAHWILEPTGKGRLRKKDNKNYLTYLIRDRQHRKLLFTSSLPGGEAVLTVQDQGTAWAQIPVASY